MRGTYDGTYCGNIRSGDESDDQTMRSGTVTSVVFGDGPYQDVVEFECLFDEGVWS